MTTAQHIAHNLGQAQMARALGLGVTAVNNAVSRGCFPTAWFLVVKGLCDEAGIVCPEDAFNFKSPSKPTARAS